MARRKTCPPVPAPYLADVPTFDQLRRTKEPRQEAARVFERLRQLIREARERYELENDVEIDPERAGIPSLNMLLAEFPIEPATDGQLPANQ